MLNNIFYFLNEKIRQIEDFEEDKTEEEYTSEDEDYDEDDEELNIWRL